MRSSLAIDVAAEPAVVFAVARDVSRWDRLLPHYARSRVIQAEPGGTAIVSFIARRPLPGPFGLLGLGLPVAWRSRCWAEPEPPRLRFVHLGGATRGMDVTWLIEPAATGCTVTIEHDFRPRLAGWATVRRPLVHPADRRADARDLQGPRRGRPVRRVRRVRPIRRVRSARADEPIDMRQAGRRDVWITGIGVVTPIGTGRDAFWAGVHEARSPVKVIDRFDPSPFRSQVAAQVDDFEPLDHMDAQTARRLDRFSQFGLVAGRLAMEDAGLRPGQDGAAEPGRIGISVGSALGGIAFAEIQHERYLDRGIKAVAPTLALAVFGGAAPANLGIDLDVRGPILSTANSCASGGVALGEALESIRSGRIDAAVAGGVEVPLSPLAFGAFDIIRALSGGANDSPAVACRPFDEGRDGFVMGEGAAMVVLEGEDVARRRGARPYASLLGYAATSDAYHMVQPRPDGIESARAASLALEDAGVQPSEIGYVNAHASSTPIGDLAEARALELALGDDIRHIPVSGTKALYGHPLGASGAIEAAICALTIHHGWAPPSVNLTSPDPDVAEILPCLLREGRSGTYDRVLSTSFGFGGLNAALVLGAIAD